jgi:hypothetical protein
MKIAILAMMFCMTAVCAETAEYLVVDLSGGPQAAKRAVRTSVTSPDIAKDDCRTGELWVRKLPGVAGLSVSVFEITQAQYEAVTGNSPSRHPGALRPDATFSIDRCYCKP